MAGYVRKEDVVNVIKGWKLDERMISEADAIDDIMAIAEPVAKWVDIGPHPDMPIFGKRFKCTACGDWQFYGKLRYCPNCGMPMEVDDDTE